MTTRRIGFGAENDSLREENERLRGETRDLRAMLHVLTDLVPDADGACHLRTEPNGPAYCQACWRFTDGRCG